MNDEFKYEFKLIEGVSLTHVWRNCQPPFLPNTHSQQTDIIAANYLSAPQSEVIRQAEVTARAKLLTTGCQNSSVMHGKKIAVLRFAFTVWNFLYEFDLQLLIVFSLHRKQKEEGQEKFHELHRSTQLLGDRFWLDSVDVSLWLNSGLCYGEQRDTVVVA